MLKRQSVKGEHIHAHYAQREDTPLESAVDAEWDEAEGFVSKIPDTEVEKLTFSADLTNAVFCGHLMADLDSVAGAIGGAYLYGGVPARASDINSETRFALEHWGCDCPVTVESLLEENPKRDICLVDFQQQSQMNKAIPMGNIVGIIDHHAIQGNAIVTEKPIFVDIRPWGSMSSILAHSFAVQEKFLPKNIAGLLLSAILSDTLNLRSPTTTKWDERMVSMLVQYIDPDMDVNMFAAKQFRAKSHELSLMTPYQLVNGDTKQFKFTEAADSSKVHTIAYGVIETTDAEASLARVDELVAEMGVSRDDNDLTAMLLAVVDIVNLTSTLFISGHVEASLAVAAYGGEISSDGKELELKGLVSRKKDFIPPLTKAFKEGWTPPAEPPHKRRVSHIEMDFSAFAPGRLTRVFDDIVLEEE